jgi:hypothetical protein
MAGYGGNACNLFGGILRPMALRLSGRWRRLRGWRDLAAAFWLNKRRGG